MPEEKNLCVVHEAIVGAFGLPPGKLFVSIKGDPSLRETVPLRPRQESRIDRNADQIVLPRLERLARGAARSLRRDRAAISRSRARARAGHLAGA